ncbi:MAG: MFS transporter [Anaerolineae bacterium]|nr:MFS transporter [Anaerolineae bacterium]
MTSAPQPSPQRHERTQRIMITLFTCQAITSAAFVVNSTVNPIVGKQLSGQTTLAGLPATLLLIGAAYAAFLAGRIVPRLGWRRGLLIGQTVGMTGMIVGGTAVATHSFGLFLLGSAMIGMARGFLDLSRYAGADANPPSRRAAAISAVVWAGTIGGITGPKLAAPLGDLVSRLGLDPLTGPMIGGLILFTAAAVILWLFLRPDPQVIARTYATASETATTTTAEAGRSVADVLRQPLAQVAVAALVIGQAVMVLVMGVTSLYMVDHNHTLEDAGWVISLHVAGMYALSPLSGYLAGRIGRLRTILLGAIVLMAGALLAPTSLVTEHMSLALFLVGLGWNLCYIGGSSLLADCAAPNERPRVQGVSDLLVNLTSASSSLSGGFILAAFGYGSLCLIGAIMALLPLTLAGWRQFRPVATATG